MTDDDDLDPALAAAFASERRATAGVVAAAGISRDRLLVAVLAKTARREPVAPAKPARRRWALAAAALGGLSLAYAAGRISAPTPPPAAVPATRAIDAGVKPDAAVDAPLPPDAPPPPRPDAARAPAASPPGPDSGEALLLDQARAALRRHLPAEALTALQRHQHAFPSGQLREDRDVLLIEVALAQDRRADANELIAAYFDRYPHGSLRSRVEALQRELDRMIRR